MGAVIAEVNGNVNGNTDEQSVTKSETAGSARNSSSTNTTTSHSGTTGRSGDRGTDGTEGTAKEKDILGLAILTEDEKKAYENADETERKRLLRNAKRREKYAKEKTEKGEQVKPRKVNKKKSTKKDEIDRTQINGVIVGLSTVIASRPNCQHWLLTETEVDSITKPLTEMLKESEIFEKVAENSNQIALVTACLTVFAPRVVTTVMIEKEKKKHAKPSGKVSNPKNENQKSNIGNDKRITNNNTNGSKDVTMYGGGLY